MKRSGLAFRGNRWVAPYDPIKVDLMGVDALLTLFGLLGLIVLATV